MKGFSLMEMILAIGIMAVVGGTVTPLAIEQMESSRATAAESEIRTLRSAMSNFLLDVQEAPNRLDTDTPNSFKYLVSNGDRPDTVVSYFSNDAEGDNLEGHLYQNLDADDELRYSAWNATLRIGWRGPYLDANAADPWHRRYYLSMAPWKEGNMAYPVWILSAGRNGQLETPHTASGLFEDDLGIRLR